MPNSFQYPTFNIQYSTSKGNGRGSEQPGSAGMPRPTFENQSQKARGRANHPGEPRLKEARSAFTLIEVLVSMAVLVILMLALTRMFVSSANITSRGLTTIARNSVGETAMDSILQDLDCMVVNERIACAKIMDYKGQPSDAFYFIGTSGDQDDDMPYEYFKLYVKPVTLKTALGATYIRYDLMKSRAIMAVGASYANGNNAFFALRQEDKEWWDLFDKISQDEFTLAENVVLFDIYCQRWDNGDDFITYNNDFYSSDALGTTSNIPPVAVDVMLVLTSPEAAIEGGMLLAAGDQAGGMAILNRESSTLVGRAMPMMGPTQYRLQRRTYNPLSHYYPDPK